MASKQQTPVKQSTARARTPSLTSTMRPPTSAATTTTPSRRLSQGPARLTAAPPKTAPRPTGRASMALGTPDRRKLAAMLKEVDETENKFVSYITDALLHRLTGCTNLKDAKILRISESDAKLKFIENMDQVPNLEDLDLSDNEIPQMRGLSCLKYLKVLNLSTNMISMIEGFESLSRLEELDLSGNQIERIPASIKALLALKVLKLHNNKLSTLRDVALLRPLKNLISLTIFQNPLAELEHSRGFCVYQLPSLSTLDDAPLDDEERTAAHERFNREEIEVLEQQLATARSEIKVSKEEIERLRKDTGASKTTEKRLGNDVNSLVARIEKLEADDAAKTDLLKKKTSELVGLCELLYEMKQELAFANIDKQFDMSAVDSIISGEEEAAAEAARIDQDNLDEHFATTGSSEFDGDLDQLDNLDDFDHRGGASSSSRSAYGSHGSSGFLSPVLGGGVISPLPFGGSIAQEFREMPYIGKTSATPARRGGHAPSASLGGATPSSRPGSRAPNGGAHFAVVSRKQLMESTAETQQAAHRYKTLKMQEEKLRAEQQELDAVLSRERRALESLQAEIAAKERFVEENPDDPSSFTTLLEIEALKERLAAQERVVEGLKKKKALLEEKLEPLVVESEQMKSLLGDLDEEAIDSAYDLTMEIKSLEAQLEDRDEQLAKLKSIINKHGLAAEVDRTVVLNQDAQLSQGPSNTNSHTETHTHTFSSEDVLAKLREMEQNHIHRIVRLINGFPKYPTNIESSWNTQPNSVDEACHTLEQQITDAFGFGFSGEALTASVASLHDRIKKLQSQVEYLDCLKYTNFFNVEDGIDENELELVSSTQQGSATESSGTSSDVQEMLFTLPKQVEIPSAEKTDTEDSSDEGETAIVGSGVTYGVRRENLGKALSRQVWFMWRVLAMKMEKIRKAWESGAISSSDMAEITSSGEWKYWSGMGRMEFFFKHAMTHISSLESQMTSLKSQLSSPVEISSVGLRDRMSAERDSLAAEIRKMSADLEMKKVDAVSLKAEMEDLEKRKLEGASELSKLDAVKSELDTVSKTKETALIELEHLKKQIETCKATKEEVAALQEKYNKLSASITEADRAREVLSEARREHAQITVQIAGMQRMKDELAAVKKDLEEAKAETLATRRAQSSSLKPPTSTSSSSSSTVRSATNTNTNTTSTSTAVAAATTASSTTNTTSTSTAKVAARTPAATATTHAASSSSSSATTATKQHQTVATKTPSPASTASSAPVAAAATPSASVSTTPGSSKPGTPPTSTTALATSISTHAIASNTTTHTDIPVKRGDSFTSSPGLTPSSSSSSLNSVERAALDANSVTDRLSSYRQKELESRKQKELDEDSKTKRVPPKRSWTVAETTGLAKPTGPTESPRKPSHSRSHSATSEQIEIPPKPAVEEEPVPVVDADETRKMRRRSLLPKDLQQFMEMSKP